MRQSSKSGEAKGRLARTRKANQRLESNMARAGPDSHQYHVYTDIFYGKQSVYFCVLHLFPVAQIYALWYKKAIGGRLFARTGGGSMSLSSSIRCLLFAVFYSLSSLR